MRDLVDVRYLSAIQQPGATQLVLTTRRSHRPAEGHLLGSGMGTTPYKESKCFRRLQQTKRYEIGTHAAHASERLDGEGLIVGGIGIHELPQAAHTRIGFGLHSDSGDTF